MIVAVSLSPTRSCESSTGLPSFMIEMLWSLTSSSVNLRLPFFPLTMTALPATASTSALRTSVTTTGVVVVVVVR